MIANDFGYEFVFSKQLEVLASKEDLLITLSCSGTSPNIIKAIEVAQKIRMRTLEFPVFEGKDRDFGKLEDKHLQLVHQIKELL